MQIKLALPKGQLQAGTAELLKISGFPLEDYGDGSRSYRPVCKSCPDVFTKVFHEKDIAIQVAIGNYDLGVCRLDWIEELLVKYPSDAVVKVRDLGYGRRSLHVVAAEDSRLRSLMSLKASEDCLRIVSEYPNLAESFALKERLRRFRIFPVWGTAESYPPENADLAMVTGASPEAFEQRGLKTVGRVLESSAYLIANRDSLETKDLGPFLGSLLRVQSDGLTAEDLPAVTDREPRHAPAGGRGVLLALPDGHQQRHVLSLLEKCGIETEGYEEGAPVRHPLVGVEGISAKVVRPQDMPFQVANGNFDLAITGRDWLYDHRCRFPSSPVEELLGLGSGRVKVVAVVSNELPVSTTWDLRKLKQGSVLRIASEYVNIADKYTHDNRLAPYKIIPTWGASEAFLPEDADVLVENTETGSTIAKNNLKIIDTLLESSACLIGNTESIRRPEKRGRIGYLIDALRRGLDQGASA